MKILADASLPGLVSAFPKPFELTQYHSVTELPSLLKNTDILLCRSTLQVGLSLLEGHQLHYVATASSGSDHIDTAYLQAYGIGLVDAKGSNAPAVADYVLSTLAYLYKFKKLSIQKAGIVGLGEVGSRVIERLSSLNIEVIAYDPPKQRRDSTFLSCVLDDLATCDLICIHANLETAPPYPSINLFDRRLLGTLKPGCIIINASRGGIVNEEALLRQKNLVYCTDVFSHEPDIDPALVNFSLLCTPHIAGHSLEAKFAAVAMVSEKLHELYQLTAPVYQEPIIENYPALENQAWEDCLLSLYNPIFETELLKNARDLKSTFLRLRKAHQTRHDFSVYQSQVRDPKIRQLLGLSSR